MNKGVKNLGITRQMKDSGVEWIGEIPLDWELKKFSHIIRNTNSGEVIPKDYWGDGDELLYTCSKNPIKSNFENFPKCKRTVKGDLLLTRNGTPYIQLPIENSIYSNVVQRVSIKNEFEIFVAYALREAARNIVGNGDIIPSFNMDIWKGLKIPIPSFREQQAIANYLDERIGKIDELIAEYNQAIENWEDYKQSLITETVTRGLNPNVEMKDSGIEWIGEIPKEWEIIRLKNLFCKRDGGAWGEECKKNDNDIICIRVADFNYLKYKVAIKDDYTKRNYKDAQINRLKLQKGDILIEKSGGGELTPVGRAVVFDLDVDALYANFMERLRLNKQFNPFFINYLLAAMYSNGVIKKYINQTTGIQNLNLTQLLIEEILYIPNSKEQQAIADFLDKKCSKIDQTIEQKQTLIKQLEEYKQSLIYECVTGKRYVL